ncbi:T9SS type A sorting domain-containing protein [Chryseobacterium sp. R2A-55]|uniref:T9SS type A sorting domain-containing protein n=1 Tax=Chryseobacterium sp. R2A-55 TaxID=2744445 RepID=UPI001F377CA5|nr:T9SS type A sorting domain-containing protein [Chryseobacterium sp. R2A-55]
MKNFHTGLEKYCLVLFVLISSFAIGQTNTWKGGSGNGTQKNDWNRPANWSLNKLPTATTDVVIPGGVANMPSIAANTSAVANNLTINAGATLTTADSSTSLLNIKGNFTNNGTLNAGAASLVTFDGNIASLIGGSSKSSFGNLAINKTASSVTSSAKTFAVNGNLTVTQGNLILAATDTDYTVGKNLTVAAAGTLTHNVAWNAYSKLLLVSGNVDISGAYSYSGAYTGAEGPRAHLQMNGPGTTIRTGSTALSILTIANASGIISANGTLTVNDNFWAPYNQAGTFQTAGNTVNAKGAVLAAGGTLDINGGTLNVTNGLYVGYGAVNGTAKLSAGTLNTDFINVGVAGQAGINTFNHSGGTANIGNLNIDGTATNTYLCTGSPTINISGTWTNNKTFTAANSTVNFTGTAAQALNGTLSGTTGRFYNLTFDGGGATLSSPIEISNKLSMTNGILNTGTNVVSLTNTSNTAANAGNVTSFVSGPVKWSMSGTANTSYVFPVGKGTTYLPFVLANVSAPTGTTPSAQAEAFDTNCGGTADLSTTGTLSTTEYWSLVTTGTFTNSSVSLSRPTNIAPFDVIGGSGAKAGAYTSLLGTVGSNGITNSSSIGANRFFVFAGKKQKIVTGTVVSPNCAGSSVSVPFTIEGIFNSGNVFTAQLSNSTGSFASPTNIGSLTQTTAGTISATIPAGTPAGSGYRIRVVSSNPNVVGTDNGANITLSDKPAIAVIAAPAAICAGGSLNPATPTVTANGSAVTAQGWQLETGVGSGVFADLTVPYAVTFADNGKKLQYHATNGCGTTTSNLITLTVNDKPTVSAIAVPTALCAGGSLNPATPTVTANGSAVTAQGWQLETGVGSGVFANLTVPYAVTFADHGKKLQYHATNGCGTTTSNQVTLTVNDKPTVSAIAAPTALCAGGSLNPATPAVTANGSAVTAQGWQLETGVGSGVFANLTVPYAVTFADHGKKLQYYVTNGCGTTISNSVTVTVSALPTASVTGNNQICKNADAVFILTGTAGATVTYNINGINQTTVVLDSSGKATVTVLSAAVNQTLNIVSVSNGTCTNSAGSSATVAVGEDSVYTGTVPTGSWTKGRPDGNGLNAVIAGNYNTSDGNIKACSCTVLSGGSLTVSANHFLEVENGVTNNGDLTIESDGNLIQVNDNAVNQGNVIVKRAFTFSPERKQYNYVSSPVAGGNLKTIYAGSPEAVYHSEATNMFYASSGANIQGRALALKEPSTAAVSGPTVTASFVGVPFNGILKYPLAYTTANPTVNHGYNLVGNPYPSDLDIDALYDDNNSKIDPTYSFWDNRGNTIFVQQGSAYLGVSYARYNAVSGTGVGAATSNGYIPVRVPNQFVKVGSGFMIRAKSTANGATLDFKNAYRSDNNSGPGFFGKSSTKDRYWLKLNTPGGIQLMTAVVYFPTGNNDFSLDDSVTSNSSDDIYTFAVQTAVAINGRAPFSQSDRVMVGVNSFTSGNYTISLGDQEGVFASGQNVYLKDHLTGIVTNLSEGSYTFSITAGQSTGRFELMYEPGAVLATEGAVKDELMVYKDGQDFVVAAKANKITGLEVYDLLGRMIYKDAPQKTKAIIDSSVMTTGVYIFRIDQGGKITTRKVIK